MSFLIAAITQGLLWSIMSLGIYVTYRILRQADLTAEGTFVLGASVVARLISDGFVSPLVATIIALATGLVAGLITALLYTKLKISALLAGILTMTALYSINLKIMGQANISLLNPQTLTINSIFTELMNLLGVDKNIAAGLIGLAFVIATVLLLWWFLQTEIGLALRAAGQNPKMTRALGINPQKMEIIGFMISNALIALSSSLVAQYNGFADISMGIATIASGLASVIIGEALFGRRSIIQNLIAVV